MTVFTNGMSIEVGIGEWDDIENGHSKFLIIDVEVITETEVEALFPHENILYIEKVTETETQSIEWSKENPISEYL